MDRQYNNELTPEVLATKDQSPFTAEQLAGMNDETRALISDQQEYCRQHPVNALCRITVDGCLTREGGQSVLHTMETKSNFQMAGKLILR